MEMAVLDRALNANPSNRLSLPLVLEQIKVASNSGIWDVQKDHTFSGITSHGVVRLP